MALPPFQDRGLHTSNALGDGLYHKLHSPPLTTKTNYEKGFGLCSFAIEPTGDLREHNIYKKDGVHINNLMRRKSITSVFGIKLPT